MRPLLAWVQRVVKAAAENCQNYHPLHPDIEILRTTGYYVADPDITRECQLGAETPSNNACNTEYNLVKMTDFGYGQF
jgi:hypothetical protein